MKHSNVTHPDFILEKARSFCSYQERCLSDVKNKLKEWMVKDNVAEKIIDTLRRDGFLDDQRYACVFSGSKFRMNKWGKNRIIYELQKKEIPDLYIQIGLQEIDEEEYITVLKQLITKKSFEIKDNDPYRSRKRLATYAISKGFEPPLVWNILKETD